MAKSIYRYDAITKDKLRDGRNVILVIHPDVFFNEEKDARDWGAQCSYFLEKSKNGIVKIVVHDRDRKVVARIAQKNLTDYEQEIEGASIRDKISFEEMFESLTYEGEDKKQELTSIVSLGEIKKNKKPMSVPLTRKAFCLQTFRLQATEDE